MGAGKSAVGRRVAERAGARFVDTDREIEREQGMPIAQIFMERGEEQFRAIETQMLNSLLARDSAERKPWRSMSLVVSTGGGLPLRDENMDLLKRLGHVLWLRARPETIVERVGHKLALRPLIAEHGGNLMERIVELQQERYPKYDMVADHVIDTDNCANPDQAAALVFEHWKRRIAKPRHHGKSQNHAETKQS
jgi:shikimate kinase